MSIQKLMFKNASILVVGNMLSMILSLVSLKLSVSILSINEFGMFGLWMATFGLAFIFVDAGLGGAHIKRISEGKDPQDCFKLYNFLSLGLLTTFTLVLVISINIFSMNIIGIENSYYYSCFYFLYSAWCITMLYQDVARSFIGLRMPLKQVLIDFSRNLTLVLLLILVLIYKKGFNYLATAYLISACIGLFVALWFSRFLWGGKLSLQLLKSYLTFGSANLFSVLVQAAAKNLDVIIVGIYLGKSDLAIYFGSKRLISFMDPLSSALSSSIIPIVSSMSVKNDFSGIRNTITQLERVTAIIVAPVLGIVICFSPILLNLILGKGYSEQPYVFVGLFSATTVFIIGLGFTFAIGAMDRPGVTFINATFSLIGWLLCIFILVPQSLFGIQMFGMGLPGIVISNLIYWILWTYLDRRFINSLVGTKFNYNIIIYCFLGVVSAIICMIIFPDGRNLFETIYLIILKTIFTFSVYFILLVVFKIVHIHDLIIVFQKLKNLINTKLSNSVKNGN